MPYTLDDVRRALARPPQPPEDAPRHAAVAAIFVGGGELLFIRRAEVPGDPWSGHVAFPGGRVEPSDGTPEAAARRETVEEIGVDLSNAERVGALDPLRPVSGYPLVVHPFVYALPARPRVRPNQEVQSVHFLGLRALLDGVGRGRMGYEWQGQALTLPCVDFDGLQLWGLTLRMVDEILHRLDGRGHGLERLNA